MTDPDELIRDMVEALKELWEEDGNAIGEVIPKAEAFLARAEAALGKGG